MVYEFKKKQSKSTYRHSSMLQTVGTDLCLQFCLHLYFPSISVASVQEISEGLHNPTYFPTPVRKAANSLRGVRATETSRKSGKDFTSSHLCQQHCCVPKRKKKKKGEGFILTAVTT